MNKLITLCLMAISINVQAVDLYYHPEGKQELIAGQHEYMPIGSFVTTFKHENDRFFWGKDADITTPVALSGKRYQEDAINYAFQQANLKLKRLAAYTYYIYDNYEPPVLGVDSASEYAGKPYISMPNYFMDILFMIARNNGYRMLWGQDLNRESYYINSILEFDGADVNEDIKFIAYVVQQTNDSFTLSVNDELKVITVTPK